MFQLPEKILLENGLEVPARVVCDITGPILTPERKTKIDQIVRGRDFGVAVVLENIYDRGNASAVMRSAEAMGYTQIHMIELGERFKNANRVTQGAEKWTEVTKWKSTKACIEKLKSQGYQICVTHLDPTAKPIAEIDFSKPTAIVLGNEKEGITPEMAALSDHRVIIPMSGFVQSYNISVAGALSLYQIQQSRLKHFGPGPYLTEAEQEILRAHYYIRSLDSAKDIIRETLRR